MINLKFPEPDFKIREERGQPEIFDGIRQKWVALQPEEWVRQNFISWLTKAAGIPSHSIAVEKGLRLGNLMKNNLKYEQQGRHRQELAPKVYRNGH